MATVHGRILITKYLTRLEQAITDPARDPAFVISLQGDAQRGEIDYALLYFDPSGRVKYGRGDVSPGLRIRVFLSYAEYVHCLDLLRNEKPIYFVYSYETFNYVFFDDGELKYYSLGTGYEEVGEEES